MALNAFLDCGIKGSAKQKNFEGQILVHGIRHLIETPRDPKTSMPEGKPNHSALAITKTVDLASAGLRQAMLTGKLIGRVKLALWRSSPGGGKEESHYSIELTGARVVAIRHLSLNLVLEPLLPDMEEIRFTYQDIKWKYHGTERAAGGGDYAMTNAEGGESKVNAAPDELETWAKDVLLGASQELLGYVRDTVKFQFAALIKEIKGPQEPPANP